MKSPYNTRQKAPATARNEGAYGPDDQRETEWHGEECKARCTEGRVAFYMDGALHTK